MNFGKNKKMTERPDFEPKFSMQNKSDKFIFWFVFISLVVVGALIAGAICLWYFGLKK